MREELCRVDQFRHDISLLKDFKHKLNYLTLMMEVTLNNSLYDTKMKLEILEELLEVQKEVRNNAFNEKKELMRLFLQEMEQCQNE